MKKLNKLGILLSSIAMAAGVIAFSGAKNQNKIPFRSDEYYERTGDSKGFYEKHNLEPVEAMSFASYTDNPGSTNVFNDDKNWYLDPISVGNTWNTYRGDGVTIAVIDTGLRSQHEDFYYNSIGKYNISEDSACFTHTGGNYYGVSTTYVKNGGSLDWTVIENSTAGHGTNVTSTIASRINNKGTVGIAPNVNILFLKAATLYSDEVSEAIKYAADKYADIITMSLGCYSSSVIHGDLGDTDCEKEKIAYANGADSLYSTAINYAYGKGCMILASAGNEDVYSNSYPACNDHVIGVGALNKSSLTKKASYSNYNSTSASASGNHNVDVTAPGSVKVADKDSNTDYVETQGTSFSCPIVAGAMALYYQKKNYGGSTNVTTRKSNVTAATNALYNSCVDIGDTGWDRMYGYGALDISKLCGTDTTNVSSISVDKTSLTINEGFTKTAIASISPIYSKNKFVNWTSSNSSVATVTSSTVTTAEATITGVSGGTCTITAKSADNASIYKIISVTVNGYVHSYFTATAKTDLTVGETTKINIDWDEGTPNDPSIMFDTSDEDVMTVDESGNVTAVGAGDGTIFIVSGDDEQEITFHVSEPVISSGPVVFTFGSNSGKDITSASGSATKNNVKVTAAGSGIEGGDLKVNGPTENAITVEGLSGVKITQVALSMTNDSQKWSADSGSFSNLVWTAASNAGVSCVRFSKGQGNGVKQSKVTQIEVTTLGGSTPSTSYTVSFNANGGSGEMPSQTTSGSYTVPSCTFTAPSGKEFDHWAIDSASGSTASGTISVTKDTTLYAVWKDKTTGGGSSDSGTYYNSITETSGTKLLGQLHDLSIEKHSYYNTYSGDNSETNYAKTDPYGSDSNYIRDFYTGGKMANTSGSSGWTTWNREHLWCKAMSNGLWSSDSTPTGGGADIQHIRPSICGINSARGSLYYGEVSGGTAVKFTDATNTELIGGYKNSTTFEPIDTKKGDVARILMYTYMHYNTYENVGGSKDNIDHLSYFGTLNFTMVMSTSKEDEAIATLLNWSNSDPVDSIETIRNTEAAKITGCRNPFIDHPEYANAIWGSTPVTEKHTTALSLDNTTASILVGGTVTLTATKTPTDSTDPIIWSTSDSTVATVTNGVVTGIKAGTATITATSNNIPATCTVTVSSTSGGGGEQEFTIEFKDSSSDGSSELNASSMMSSTYVVQNTLASSASSCTKVYAGTYGLKIGSKNDAGNFTLNLVNDANSNIKSIDVYSKKYGSDTGTVKFTLGSESGSFSPTADGSKQSKTFNSPINASTLKIETSAKRAYVQKVVLHVGSANTPQITSVSLNETALSFDLLNDFSPKTLVATVSPAEAANKEVTWSSSAPEVATVLNGVVTPVTVGTTTITATSTVDSTKYASCVVTVSDSRPISVTGVSLDTTSTSISVGSTITLTATVTPTNASNKNVSWSTSNSSVATVSNGTVTALAVGNATITVKTEDGDYTATCALTVTSAPVITYQLEADETTVPYMSGTNHSVSVGVKLYQYTNGVKGSQVSSGNSNVDTSVLGSQEISYTYQSVVYKTTVKVTNNGAEQGNEGNSETITYGKSNKLSPSSTKTGTVNGQNGKCTQATYTTSNFTMVIDVGSSTIQVGNGSYSEIGNDFRLYTNQTVTFTGNGNNLNYVEIGIASSNITAIENCTVQTENGKTIITATDPSTSFKIKCTAKVEIKSNSVSFNIETTGTKAFTDEEQANAWADYFIRETRTLDTCLASTDAAKLAGLKNKWAELANEYEWMVSGAKDEFCTSTDSRIVEAREHYKYIVSKFGASNLGTDGNFVTNGQGTALNTNATNRFSIVKFDNQTTLIVVISLISVTSLGLYFYLKRKKEIE